MDQRTRPLLIRFDADPRYHAVVQTAVEIYMRPICGDDSLVPEVVAEIETELERAAPGTSCQVEFRCARPELVTTVTVGKRETTRRWQVEE
jgi:hypothetical protein